LLLKRLSKLYIKVREVSGGRSVALCEDTPFEHLKGLSAGDLIKFDVKIDENLHRVDKPILLKGYEAGDVAASLINSAHATSMPTGKILTFPSPKPINAVSGLPSERAM
jgi:hypothetical protein